MAQYATGADLVVFYDRRRLSELVSDTGSPVPPERVADHPVVAAVLAAASDEVAAACGVGKRYTPAELATLAAGNDAGGPLLRMIVAHLAYGLLVSRRGLAATDQGTLTPMREWAENYLTMLRNGERVFGGVEGVLDAGLPTTVDMRPQQLTQTPSLVSEAYRIFGSGPVTVRPPFGR